LSEASGEYSTTYPLLLCHGKYCPVSGKGIKENNRELLRHTPGTTTLIIYQKAAPVEDYAQNIYFD